MARQESTIQATNENANSRRREALNAFVPLFTAMGYSVTGEHDTDPSSTAALTYTGTTAPTTSNRMLVTSAGATVTQIRLTHSSQTHNVFLASISADNLYMFRVRNDPVLGAITASGYMNIFYTGSVASSQATVELLSKGENHAARITYFNNTSLTTTASYVGVFHPLKMAQQASDGWVCWTQPGAWPTFTKTEKYRYVPSLFDGSTYRMDGQHDVVAYYTHHFYTTTFDWTLSQAIIIPAIDAGTNGMFVHPQMYFIRLNLSAPLSSNYLQLDDRYFRLVQTSGTDGTMLGIEY